MIPSKIFYIPKKTDIIVVSDMFSEDYSGGAELTLEAILAKAPGRVYKLHSMSLTPELIEANKDKLWILGNFSQVSKENLIELVTSKVKYVIIECDYKYCSYRSSHLHKLQQGKDCDCHLREHGFFIRAFFQRAHKVFFMSVAQMQEYIRLFPQIKPHNFCLQSSTFSDDTIVNFSELRAHRDPNDKWAIVSGGSWIKAERETVEWCKNKGFPYELLGGLSPDNFLKKLSTMKGLVFRPAGYDTCPRLVIEAKMLGLELELNDLVQHRDESWFKSDIKTCENYLKTRARDFWNKIDS